MFTYQTRLAIDAGTAAVLDVYAALQGRVERALFAAQQAGGQLNALKREFIARFGITARQFNAIRVGLDGKVAAIKERRPALIVEAQARIRKAEQVIARLEARRPGTAKVHQKKRRLAIQRERLSALLADQDSGQVRLCFGSRRLFQAQFALAENGYASHEAWRADWRSARADQVFVLGSQDEMAGNQTCQARVAADGSLSLVLRLPSALEQGRVCVLDGVRFAYGHATVVAALASSRRVPATTRSGKPTVKRVGSALSYRFVRDAKGWRVFVSVEAPAVAVTTRAALGALGVDINADHLAVTEVDRHGNRVASRRIDLPCYGKTGAQARALIGDACVAIAAQAREAGKPVVVEALDFQRRKTELDAANPRQARMLSSLAYSKTITGLEAACFRAGVEVVRINPAYTSVIGAVNHARRCGISVHQGAAYAIARRGLGLSEAAPEREAIVPTRVGGHVTFALPARNRAKHVWSHWAQIRTRLKAAHAAHVRCGGHRGPPPPLSPERPTARATRASPAKPLGANRSQHCSESVMDIAQ